MARSSGSVRHCAEKTLFKRDDPAQTFAVGLIPEAISDA
jgi:hypothetical protein